MGQPRVAMMGVDPTDAGMVSAVFDGAMAVEGLLDPFLESADVIIYGGSDAELAWIADEFPDLKRVRLCSLLDAETALPPEGCAHGVLTRPPLADDIERVVAEVMGAGEAEAEAAGEEPEAADDGIPDTEVPSGGFVWFDDDIAADVAADTAPEPEPEQEAESHGGDAIPETEVPSGGMIWFDDDIAADVAADSEPEPEPEPEPQAESHGGDAIPETEVPSGGMIWFDDDLAADVAADSEADEEPEPEPEPEEAEAESHGGDAIPETEVPSGGMIWFDDDLGADVASASEPAPTPTPVPTSDPVPLPKGVVARAPEPEPEPEPELEPEPVVASAPAPPPVTMPEPTLAKPSVSLPELDEEDLTVTVPAPPPRQVSPAAAPEPSPQPAPAPAPKPATKPPPVPPVASAWSLDAPDLHIVEDDTYVPSESLYASREEVRDLVESLGELPSVPKTYSRLCAELDSPRSSMVSVARVLERDVAVSGRLLQVVNSALYSMPRKVSGLQQAAGLLGLMALRNMVLAVEVFGSFRSPQRLPGISLDVLQARAHGRATLARTLAPRRLADSAYTAGLLRDIGRMVLMTRASDRYIACCYLVTTGLTWEQAEIEVFGVASRNLGGHLLRRWELPGEVLAAVEMVDDPGDPTVGGLVELAELFVREAAHAAEHPDEDPLMLVTRDMLEPLGLVSKAQTARDLARTMSKGLLEPPVQSAA